MENSIRAIYMGVGMLIAILVIGIFVYMFRSAASFGEKYEEGQAQRQIQAFNAQFEVYLKETVLDGKGNTAAEVISCANLVNSINAKNEYDEQNQITMTVETDADTFYIYPTEEQPNNAFMKRAHATSDMSFSKFLNKYNEIKIVDDEVIYKYYFDVNMHGITYSEKTGKVTSINFYQKPATNW